MYGSIFKFNLLPGKEAEAKAMMEANAGADQERLKSSGMVASYVFRLDSGGYMGVAVFEDKEKYQSNANDPRQHEWYLKFRAMTDADPEWHDGEVVSSAP